MQPDFASSVPGSTDATYFTQMRDTDAMFAFRQRMATEDAKATPRRRPSIAEFPNADCRNRGFYQFRVRRLTKVRAATLWHAISFNFLRMLDLSALPNTA